MEELVSEKLERLKTEWALLKAKADEHSELKKTIFSNMFLALKKQYIEQGSKITDASIEREVYASKAYSDYLLNMVEAAKKANLKSAELEGFRQSIREEERSEIRHATMLKHGNYKGEGI